MRLSILIIELNRLQRCRSRSWICLERFYVNVRQEKPDLRDPGPGPGQFRIFLKSALKEMESLPQVLFAAFVRQIETLQVKIICFRIPVFMGRKGNGELDLESANNCPCDFVLERKYSLQFAFV